MIDHPTLRAASVPILIKPFLPSTLQEIVKQVLETCMTRSC